MANPQESLFSNVNPRVVLHNFYNACKRLIWFVLLAALAFGFYKYKTLDSAYSPYYMTSAVFSVSASYNATTDIASNNDHVNTVAAETLSATFRYIINSENTQMLLKQALGRDTIPGSINATSTAEAALFTLTVTSWDAQAAYDVLCATIDVYPQAASTILGDTRIDTINMPSGPPTKPINENNALSVAIKSTFPIIALGLVLIFLLALTRKTVHSADDLRKLVNLKCLAYVPSIKLKKHSNNSNLKVTITNSRISSLFTESIRNLRIKVEKAMEHRQARVLLISSTVPNEGKSTVSTNLALSLAAEGHRVILIDGDLRKQSLKGALGINEPSDGLVEFLSGATKNFRLLSVPNSSLLLLSGDKTNERPQAMIDSPRMHQLISLLRERLDYIIIDTPPAGMLSDAAVLAKHADAALYVVRQDMASTTQIVNALQGFSSVGVPLIGCVLNHTQAGTTRSGYGSKYSTTYGYSYGYKYSDGYHYSSYSRRYVAENAPAEPAVSEKERKKTQREVESLSRDLRKAASEPKN